MAKLQRKEILLRLGKLLDDKDIVVAALAGTTNECFHNMHRPGNLYLVGMGMVTPVCFGLARALPKRRIIALDTDGSQLLAPSIFSVVATYQPKNLCMIVFDNEHLYGSRGGPESQTAHGTDLAAIAKGAGIGRAAVEMPKPSLKSFPVFSIKAVPPKSSASQPVTPRRRTELQRPKNKFRLVRLIEETEGDKDRAEGSV
jgi:thiamine pyrophosphate-dependent acetolactate synthase large subunit-like protein